MGVESLNSRVPEQLIGLPYTEVFNFLTEGSFVREYLHYNDKGELCINRLNVSEVVEKYGAPVLILNTELIKQRAGEWQEMANLAAKEAGYTGGFELVYAAKANPHSAAVVAADRAGCGHETSSFHDLLNLYGLFGNGVINKDVLVFCNGFKLPPRFNPPIRGKEGSRDIIFESIKDRAVVYQDDSYADLIVRMIKQGYQVLPVLDSGESAYFVQKLPKDRKTAVGLRAKFGKVTTMDELAQWESRHGMDWEELHGEAARIKDSPNLELTMLHTMVGAAETIPIEKYVASLSLAADMYFTLKKENPSLQALNNGGGMAPRSEKNYNHGRFLRELFLMLKQKATEHQLPEPKVIFEFGSYVVSEAGFYVFEVIQKKYNQVTATGKKVEQLIVEGGLMESLPDRFILGKDFLWVAGNQANRPAIRVKVGDITCDSDGKVPREVFVPDGDLPLYLVVAGIGAYQDILGGKGPSHCLVEEPKLVIVEKREDDLLHVRDVDVSERATRVPLGYTSADYELLKKAI